MAAAKKSGINVYELENYLSEIGWRIKKIPVLPPDSNTTQAVKV